MRAALAGLVALAALPSCAPQSCDPSQAGFLSGIGCEASGSYGVRRDAQQQALAQQNALALQNQAAAQQEGARATDALVARDQARRRLGAVDQQTRALRARLASARARAGANPGRLDAAQADLDQLERQRGAVGSAPSEAQLRALEEQRRRLNDALSGI